MGRLLCAMRIRAEQVNLCPLHDTIRTIRGRWTLCELQWNCVYRGGRVVLVGGERLSFHLMRIICNFIPSSTRGVKLEDGIYRME